MTSDIYTRVASRTGTTRDYVKSVCFSLAYTTGAVPFSPQDLEKALIELITIAKTTKIEQEFIYETEETK